MQASTTGAHPMCINLYIMKLHRFSGKQSSAFIVIISLIVMLASCESKPKQKLDGNEIEMRHAHNISMVAINDSVTVVTLTNPWDTTTNLAKYALVERGYSNTSSLPTDMTVIEVPLQQAIVYSGVHASLIKEFGAFEAIKGVCDAEYISDYEVKESIKRGDIADCGYSTSPLMEKIMTLKPDAVLLSPFENSDETSKFARIGTNVIQMADYMESTPLGRAEWLRFYGRLFDKGERADSLFSQIASAYETSKAKASKASDKPKVLFDRPYNGVWDVPTSGSVTGKLIEDAGGRNPFAQYRQGGSAHLSPEEVIHTASDADVWLIRHTEPNLTMQSLEMDNTLYGKIKAYKNANVYGANTLVVPLFDDGSFHPDRVLEEMVRLLHPNTDTSSVKLRYYNKLK